jgi:DNA-directed RNA polymerase specialized sigma24 family protein
MTTSTELKNDRKLIDNCIAGDALAWEEIYQLYHDRLVMTIRQLTFGTSVGSELVDEIAARVWFSLVDNQCRLLDRFDPERGCRLIAFLTGIAKFETLNFFRSERRRRRREEIVSTSVDRQHQSQWQQYFEIDDFKNVLTPGELSYLSYELESEQQKSDDETGEPQFSDTSRWQFRSRIQKKLRVYSSTET